MRKNYVLDTNVLLHDPRALFQFKDNNVIIPIYVVEEIDKFKRDKNEAALEFWYEIHKGAHESLREF